MTQALMDGDVASRTMGRHARRVLANRLVELRGRMSRQRAGRLLGEKLGRGPLSAARIGNFEQANYHQSLPSERQLEALAEIYDGDNARVVAAELIELLHVSQSCQQTEALGSPTASAHAEQGTGTTKGAVLVVPPFWYGCADEVIASGFREELVTRLAKLLGVIVIEADPEPAEGESAGTTGVSRPTTFVGYELRGVATGRELDLRLVLDLRRMSDGMLLWSASQPFSPGGLAAAEAGVSKAMAEALALLPPPGIEPVKKPQHSHTDHASAYDFYLKGRGLLVTNAEPDFVTGLALLRMACKLAPDLADAHAWMGYALWRCYFAGWGADATTLQSALNSATYALELDHRCTAARMTLVRIYWDLGLHERGLAEGITAAHESPGCLDAALALSRALTNAGMAGLAFPITQRALCLDADNATAKKLLIWNHLLLRQHEEAIRAAQRYQQANGLDANTAWALTAALGWLGRIQEAEKVAQQALRFDSANFALWLLLGYARRLRGDTDGAQLAWRQGVATVTRRLATHQTNYRAMAWVANMQAGSGYRSEAIGALARIRIADPVNGYLHYRLAHVAAELGQTDEAILLLRTAIEAGFLSVQLMRCEQLCGLSRLVHLPEYQQVTELLERKVERLHAKYAPLLPHYASHPAE
ncbi:MAG: tetratricopeptide repeat protein [Egibacteraceae bacterium]